MMSYGIAELIYVSQARNDNGSPIRETISVSLPVKEIAQFSRNYYSVTESYIRSMRESRNLVVPYEATKDIVRDGVRFELRYVYYQNLKYSVREVLKYYKMSTRKILDCQEVR